MGNVRHCGRSEAIQLFSWARRWGGLLYRLILPMLAMCLIVSPTVAFTCHIDDTGSCDRWKSMAQELPSGTLQVVFMNTLLVITGVWGELAFLLIALLGFYWALHDKTKPKKSILLALLIWGSWLSSFLFFAFHSYELDSPIPLAIWFFGHGLFFWLWRKKIVWWKTIIILLPMIIVFGAAAVILYLGSPLGWSFLWHHC